MEAGTLVAVTLNTLERPLLGRVLHVCPCLRLMARLDPGLQ